MAAQRQINPVQASRDAPYLKRSSILRLYTVSVDTRKAAAVFSFNDLKKMCMHNIDSLFLNKLKENGMKVHSVDQIINLKKTKEF